MIRRILIPAATIGLLLCALVTMWAFRYETVPGSATLHLMDLRAAATPVAGTEWSGGRHDPTLRLWVGEAHPEVALRLALPGISAVESLHLRYRLHARGLDQGAEKWQTGRIMIEWHPPDGSGEPEIDPVGGIVDDKRSERDAMVAVSARGPAIPALRLEHLGESGEFTLSELEIIPVRERPLWKTGRWFLAAGFFAWLYGYARRGSRLPPRWRTAAAACVWLVMGWQFVVPGPWKIQRPMLVEFILDGGTRTAAAEPGSPAAAAALPSGAVTPSGKIMPEGGLPLRVKNAITAARPLLHVLLLFAPTFASAWLIGRRATLQLAVLSALAIELAQMAFGFRFDWLDALDLVTNAAGIAAGLWLAGRCSEGTRAKGAGKWRFPRECQ